MKRLIRLSVLFLIGAISVGSVSLITPARAETLVGSNVDNRITVALRVGPAASQGRLPAPWQVNPVPKGPFKGANLFVVFIDRLLNQDAKGKPADGGAFRIVALAVSAKHPQTGKSALFVTRIYGPHEGPGPYKNSVKATVRREATLQGANLEPGAGRELWKVQDSAGGILEFRMAYQRAVPSRKKKKSKLYSAVDPSFFRIYQYDQIMDVVKSTPANINRVSDYQLRVTMSELRKLFDGTEQLVGIALVPSYRRQTFLP